MAAARTSRSPRRWPALVLAAALGCGVLAGCSSSADEADAPAGHTHGPGGVSVSLPVGDGTRASEVGYTLADVRLPAKARQAGTVSFRIENHRGRPVRRFLVEQTKKMHTYLVRDDLEVFRHIHPRMGRDGTWTTRTTLPTGGRYRLVAEFVAEDEGGNGDHLILGASRHVKGPAEEVEPADDTVQVSVGGPGEIGPDERLHLTVQDALDRPVNLGTYLGTFAHLTGFHRASGSVVHMHPLGEPENTEGGTRLTFHTAFTKPGEYLLYVQVRVDGFLHTVPVEASVRD